MINTGHLFYLLIYLYNYRTRYICFLLEPYSPKSLSFDVECRRRPIYMILPIGPQDAVAARV